MSPASLIIAGPPPGTWPSVAAAFAAQVRHDTEPGAARGASTAPAWHVEASPDAVRSRLQADDAGVPCLVVVEHPADACAAWIAGGGSAFADWSRQWRAGARELLQHARATRRPCLLVTLRDLQDHPAAVADAIGQWLGGPAIRLDAVPARPEPADPLITAVARALVHEDRALRQVHAELQASCLAFGDPAGVVADAGLAPWDAGAALAQLRKARASAEQAVAQEREAESRKSRELLMGRQIDQLQDELVSVMNASQQERVRAAEAVAASQRFKEQLAALRASVDADAESRKRRETMLGAQLDQLQAEVESSYARIRELEGAFGLQRDAFSGLTIDSVALTSRRDEAPHREITFTLGGLSIAGLHLAELAVRLVEHHGHAGLVLLAPAGRPPALRGWLETGVEASWSYMLLVPSDRNTDAAFDGLGTTDWALVRGIAAIVEQAARAREVELGPRWAIVAARLRREISQLPARLRHDAASLDVVTESPRVLELQFSRVAVMDRQIERLRLRWHVAAQRIELLRPAVVTDVPLLGWPLDAGGHPAESLVLAFDDPRGDDTWRGLDAVDRSIVRALVAALPGALRVAVTPGGVSVAELGEQARRMAQAIDRVASGPRGIRLARALMRRGAPAAEGIAR